MFIVFDLDGTLADLTHRVHHVRNGNRNYDAFFAAVGDDKPIALSIRVLQALHRDNRNQVEIWSGRSDQCQAETLLWLAEKAGIDACAGTGLAKQIPLRMRKAGDYRSDEIVKAEFLDFYGRPGLVFDDRQRVVDMWRSKGIPCFQVAPGDFDAPKTIMPHDVFLAGEPILHMLIGPSGAGKTTYAKNFAPDAVLSSDRFRDIMTGSWKSQARNGDVFQAMRNITATRIACGIPTVIDATNIKRKDRLAFVDLVPAHLRVRYHVIDRPLDEKTRDGGWRNEVMMGMFTLIEQHHDKMQSNLKDILAGDDRHNVEVHDARAMKPRPVGPLISRIVEGAIARAKDEGL